jgi:N-acetylmuramoyl-L-alanine amidase-like protein
MVPAVMPCASQNFHVGRPAGLTPSAIVVHRTGSRDALRARFNNPDSTVSAHYVVGRDGQVEQYVVETDTAFHEGMIVGSTWRLLRSNVTPTFYTLGIELEGEPGDEWPEAQIAAAADLIATVTRRWNIPIDADHIVRHSAIRAGRACPGDACPIGDLIAMAQGRVAATRVPRQTVVQTLSRTNLRDGVPFRQARIVRVIAADTDVRVTEFTDAGDPVDGNPLWYGDGAGGFLWAEATNVPHPTVDDGTAPDRDLSAPPRSHDAGVTSFRAAGGRRSHRGRGSHHDGASRQGILFGAHAQGLDRAAFHGGHDRSQRVRQLAPRSGAHRGGVPGRH